MTVQAMSRANAMEAAEYAAAIDAMIASGSPVPPWVQHKLSRARTDLGDVRHFLETSGALAIGCCGPKPTPFGVGARPSRGQFVMPFGSYGTRVGARPSGSGFGSSNRPSRVPQRPLPATNAITIQRFNSITGAPSGAGPRLVARANRAQLQSWPPRQEVILRVGAPVKVLRKETLTITRRPNKLTIGGNLLRRMFGRG